MAFGAINGETYVQVVNQSIVRGVKNNGVASGFAVTEKGGGADMSVDVALGTGFSDGDFLTKTSTTNVAVTASDPALDRIDIVVIDADNVIAVTAGVAATVPAPPDIASDEIGLRTIDVGAGVTQINNADLRDISVEVLDNQIGFIDTIINVMNLTKQSYSGNFPLDQETSYDNIVVGFSDDFNDWDRTNSTGCEIVAFDLGDIGDAGRKVFIPGVLYDQYNGSISATLWTVTEASSGGAGTTSEDSGGLTGGGTAQINALGNANPGTGNSDNSFIIAKDEDFKLLGDATLHVVGSHRFTQAVASPTGSGQIIVGSTVVDSVGLVAATELDVLWQVVFDKSLETVDVYQDGVLTANNIDISGEGTWFVKINTLFNGTGQTNPAGDCDVKITNLYINDGTAIADAVVRTKVHTTTATQNRAIVHWDQGTNDSTVTIDATAISFDNGSNFETFNDATGEHIHTIPNTGTQLIGRATVQNVLPDGTKDNLFNFPSLIGYGLMTLK